MTDPLEMLLPELAERVLSNLIVTDLLSCSRVSRLWNNATNNDILWKNLCIRRGWKKCYEFDNCIECFKSFNDEEMQRICSYGKWKKYFVLRNRIKYNWMYGNFKQLEVFVTPEADQITCTSMSNTTLAIGCSNGLVQVFDIRGEHKLIQTIKCKKRYYIRSVSLSSEYLAFCNKYLLFVFKVNGKGTFDFRSMKLISETNVLSISDPSDFIGDHYSDDDDYTDSGYSIDNLGVKFCMNDEFLVAANPISQAIIVWNLNTPTIEVVCMFEREKGTSVACIDLMDEVVSATFIHSNDLNNNHYYYWFIRAFSLRDKIQLYRSATIREQNSSPLAALDASLQTSTSYTVNSIFYSETAQNKVYLFNNKTGKLIYQAYAGFIDILAYPDDNDFVAIEKNDSLLIYNPKTDSTIISIDMQGMFIGICNDVLVTECEEYDRFGSSGPKFEFWRLKDSHQSDCPLLVLPKDYELTGAFSETSILFVGSGSIFMLNSMV